MWFTISAYSPRKEHFVAVFDVVTERKRAEEALQAAKQAAEASQAQYEQTVAMISNIVWRYEVDSQGQFVASYASPVADRLLGLPAGTIDNSFEKYFSYVDPEDLPSVRKTLLRVLSTLAKDMFVEYRLRKPDGTTLWVRSKGSAYPPAGRTHRRFRHHFRHHRTQTGSRGLATERRRPTGRSWKTSTSGLRSSIPVIPSSASTVPARMLHKAPEDLCGQEMLPRIRKTRCGLPALCRDEGHGDGQDGKG